MYNEGVTALNAGDKATAIGYFEEALGQAAIIGPEADELAYNCQRNIPTLLNAIGKELAAANDIDSAIVVLNQAIAKAEEYGQNDLAAEAITLIPQLYMQQGNLFLNQKDYDAAIESYKKVVEANPNGLPNWDRRMLLTRKSRLSILRYPTHSSKQRTTRAHSNTPRRPTRPCPILRPCR